jgi:putative ABC transport system substrate-binding protein
VAFIFAVATWPALVWAGAAFGQAKKPPVLIGWLSVGSREAHAQRIAAFKDELAALGWKEGSQIIIEERAADGRRERLQPLAEELAAKKPAIIVASSTLAAAAAAKAAPKTPIVIATGDLVATGLAKSLARPGGMVTGVTSIRGDIAEKYVELLLVAAPKVKRVGFLADPNAAPYRRVLDAARRSVAQHGVEARFADAGKPEEIEPALSRLAKEGAQALVLLSGAMFVVERRRIVKLALAQRWPVIAGETEMAEEGALLSYGADYAALHRRVASYVDRILKGAKPGDLPIEQPTTFELVVNARTARALGLTLPPSIMVQATRVIE